MPELMVPAVQFSQPVERSVAAYWPALQATQLTFSEENIPDEQLVHLDWPGPELTVPAVQFSQEGERSVAAYWPAAQGVHSFRNSSAVPFRQAVHSDRPSPALMVPNAQSVQLLCPSFAAYFPITHEVQETPPGLARPAEHLLQESPAPAGFCNTTASSVTATTR